MCRAPRRPCVLLPLPRSPGPLLTGTAPLPTVPSHHLQHEGPLVAVDTEQTEGISAKAHRAAWTPVSGHPLPQLSQEHAWETQRTWGQPKDRQPLFFPGRPSLRTESFPSGSRLVSDWFSLIFCS